MGGCASKHDARHMEIEKELKKDRRAAELEMKLLLLGAGQSGKSTIAKQFKIIRIGNYEEAELMEYRVAIIENIFSAIKALVQGAEEKGIKIAEDVQASAARIAALNPTTALIQDYKDDIIKLWNDKGIREAYARSREFQLNDNAQYVLDSVNRVAASDYLPSQDDVLKTRVRTTGVMEINFPMDEFKVRLVDVGGQRAERRKWMGCFDDVTAVLFCVALSEYDQRLLEDDETNRTEESMKVFLDVTGKWFPKTTIILFLNKKDLFAEKIKTSPLKRTFPDYEGPDDYEPAAEFMKDKFLALDPNKEDNRIFPHFTCATDTDNIRVVFDAVSETLVKGNLKNAGLLQSGSAKRFFGPRRNLQSLLFLVHLRLPPSSHY